MPLATLASHGYLLDSEIEDPDTEILFGDDDSPLICTLTQMDIENNSNKFIVIHAIRQGVGFFLYTRNGRVGYIGRSSMKKFPAKESCISGFKAYFKSKTANVWGYKDKFERRMDYYSVFSFGEKEPDLKSTAIPPESAGSTTVVESFKKVLPGSMEYLYDLFCNSDMIKAAVCTLDIDLKKLPNGIIPKRNIEIAKEILVYLSENLDTLPEDKLRRESERYYMLIPSFSKNTRTLTIDSNEKIKNLYKNLLDIENLTQTITLVSAPAMIDKHQLLYDSIAHKIELVPEHSDIYKSILKYFINSHGHIHHFHLKLKYVFSTHNPVKTEIYERKYGGPSGASPAAGPPCRKELLVHGSRISNWRSILQNGLLLDPSKFTDKITGKMFGNGIYFANSFSKSAQYCPLAHGCKETICLALAEVAVGKQNKMLGADSSLNASTIGAFDSTWGLGKHTPSSHEMYDGYGIPNGKLHFSPYKDASLVFDEKIIYDQDRYNFKFLVIAEMN